MTRPRAFGAAAVALASAALVGGLALPEREGRPTIADEFVYVMQAQIFARGRLALPAPAVPEAFEAPHVLVEPVYAGKYFPAHAMLLAPFAALGMPLALPVLLAGLTALFIFAAVQRRSGLAVAALAAVLFATDLRTLLTFGTLLSNTTSTFAVAGALWTASGLSEDRRARRWAALGAFAGLALATRPMTGVALAAGAFACWLRFQRAPRALLALAAPLACSGLLLLAYDARITGSALKSPWALWAEQYSPFDKLGFGPVDRRAPMREVPPQIASHTTAFLQSRLRFTPARALQAARARAADAAETAGSPLLAAAAAIGLAFTLTSPELLLATVYLAVLFPFLLLFHWDVFHYHVDYAPALLLLAAAGLQRGLGDLAASDRARAIGCIAAMALLALDGQLLDGQVFPLAAVALGAIAGAVALARSGSLASLLSRLGGTLCIAGMLLSAVEQRTREHVPAERPARIMLQRLFEAAKAKTALERGILFVRYSERAGAMEEELPIVNSCLMPDCPGALVAVDRGAKNADLLAHYPGRPAFVFDAASLALQRYTTRPP